MLLSYYANNFEVLPIALIISGNSFFCISYRLYFYYTNFMFCSIICPFLNTFLSPKIPVFVSIITNRDFRFIDMDDSLRFHLLTP